MKGYEPVMSFDEDTAARSDVSRRGDEDATVAFLESLARGGPALELGIGTGRIALPLAQRGIQVDGIDFSPAMVERLRSKPGGGDFDITMGDFAEVAVSGQYRLVYIIFNALFNLLTQDDQMRCFDNVAARLDDGGVFVVEGYIPSWLHRLRDGQYVDVKNITASSVRLYVGKHDPVEQTLDESHVELSACGVSVVPVVHRYAWPAELDLMARIAGLRLRERWGGWERQPFTADSRNCISVYEC